MGAGREGRGPGRQRWVPRDGAGHRGAGGGDRWGRTPGPRLFLERCPLAPPPPQGPGAPSLQPGAATQVSPGWRGGLFTWRVRAHECVSVRTPQSGLQPVGRPPLPGALPWGQAWVGGWQLGEGPGRCVKSQAGCSASGCGDREALSQGRAVGVPDARRGDWAVRGAGRWGAWPRGPPGPHPPGLKPAAPWPLRPARGDSRTKAGRAPRWGGRGWTWSGNTNRPQAGAGGFLPDRCAGPLGSVR